jgi:hypothetical protein
MKEKIFAYSKFYLTDRKIKHFLSFCQGKRNHKLSRSVWVEGGREKGVERYKIVDFRLKISEF